MLRHQVSRIDCATDLFDPELLVFPPVAAARSSWCPHVWWRPPPTAESPLTRPSQPSCCCSVCPHSYTRFVSQLSYRVGQPDGPTCTSYHVVVLGLSISQDTTFCVDDQVAKVCCTTRKHPPDVEHLFLVHPAASASESPSIVMMLLFVLQRELPYSSCRVQQASSDTLQTCEV